MKFLNDQAIMSAPNATLIRFAQRNGSAKNNKDNPPKYAKNLPGWPNEVPAVFHPVITKCWLSIITNGWIVQYNNATHNMMPIV